MDKNPSVVSLLQVPNRKLTKKTSNNKLGGLPKTIITKGIDPSFINHKQVSSLLKQKDPMTTSIVSIKVENHNASLLS